MWLISRSVVLYRTSAAPIYCVKSLRFSTLRSSYFVNFGRYGSKQSGLPIYSSLNVEFRRCLSELNTPQQDKASKNGPPLLGLGLDSSKTTKINASHSSEGKVSNKISEGPTVEPVTIKSNPENKINNCDVVVPVVKMKPSLLRRLWNELVHYYHGFRLLGLEVKIALGICFRVMRGEVLTRRERKQLVRTFADIVRLVPFAVFIIVPFMEFLLPVYLKFFPFMLPSTFKEKDHEDQRARQRLAAKLELTRFLQETLLHTTKSSEQSDQTPTVAEFQSFLKKVQQSGQLAEPADIVRFSKVFEDQVTLDSLDHHHLKMLCQVLGVPTIGPSNLLRFQIWLRVRQLKAEDRLIASEGVEHIPPWELQSLSHDRGMRSAGLSEERLRQQLSQWLDLHLEKNVPITLLLFSRALHVSESALDEGLLQQAIAKLPGTASDEAALRVFESSPTDAIDPKVKIDVLRKEQESIVAARLLRKQEEAKQKATEIVKVEEVIPDVATDKAPVIEDQAAEFSATPELKDKAQELQPELIVPPTPSLQVHLEEAVKEPVPIPGQPAVPSIIAELPKVDAEPVMVKVPSKEAEPVISAGDLAQIGSAIANLSDAEALPDQTLGGLKEKVAETAKLHQKSQAALVTTAPVDKRITKAASRLGKRVDQMIGEMDSMIDKLNKERTQLLKDIELREVHVKHAEEEAKKTEILDAIRADHDRLIDMNDLLLALRRIQKVPDDTRWQKILEVLDEDHDGKIELHHVLSRKLSKVIELLGSENVKLEVKEMARILEMIDNEELAARIVESEELSTSGPKGKELDRKRPSSPSSTDAAPSKETPL